MVRPWCLVLAALCLLAAFLLPVREIDARRAAHSNRLQTEANAEAALLEPGDDSYVDYINEPYPVSSGWLYRWLLLGDAVLLGGLAWFPLSIFSDSRGPGLGSRLR